MKKQVLLGLAGGGLLIVGLVAGLIFGDNLRAMAAGNAPRTAQAAPGASTDYCQLYVDTLAKELGVTTDKLKSANRAAAQTTIDQASKDGKLTTDQKNKLNQALQKYANNPCALVNAAVAPHGTYEGLRKALGPARAAIESAVAGSLKISTSTLRSDLAAGKTIPQIAKAQNVEISTVNTAYLNAVKSELGKAVSSGMITQSQSDAIYARMQQAVQSGYYPLLEAGNYKGREGHPTPRPQP